MEMILLIAFDRYGIVHNYRHGLRINYVYIDGSIQQNAFIDS